MEKEAIKFLEEQTRQIKPLIKKLTYSYWDATTTGRKEAYEEYESGQKEIAHFFNNKENFRKVKEFLELDIQDQLVKRQLIILYNSYLGNQGDINLINKILEKSTAIEQKFNTFRAKINGKELTDNQIKNILKTETDSKKLQEAWEASKLQGELVAKEVIDLVKLRNQLAQSLGFKNYYHLSLECSEQNEGDLIKTFDKLNHSTKSIFKEAKGEIDRFLSKKYKTPDLKPWHYQNLFFQEAPPVCNVNLDKFYQSDILDKAVKFYASIGLDVSDIVQRSDLYEKPGKYQHAYCMDMDKEGDVRTLMNLKNEENWMDTTLHELGHGIYSKSVNKNLPFLLRDQSHILTTEAIALLFGKNSKNSSFLRKFCNADPKEIEAIGEDLMKARRLNQLVFSRWCEVMFNFERKLYDNPDQDLNKLWWDSVKQYQGIDFYRNKADWASKIHLVSSPAYYHNYMIGELFAAQINHYIGKNILKQESVKNLDYSGHKEIGNYLISKIFSPGAVYKWDELIKNSTGEDLNPEYWVKEFC